MLRLEKPIADGSCVWSAAKIFMCTVMRRTRPHTRPHLPPHEQIWAEYDAQLKFLLVWTRF